MIPSVPTVPFATTSKKQQPYHRSFKKASGLPQILIVAVALLSLLTPTQFLSLYIYNIYLCYNNMLLYFIVNRMNRMVHSEPCHGSPYRQKSFVIPLSIDVSFLT